MGTEGEAPHRHSPAMTTTYATAADFTAWAERAKGMTVAALLYTVNDCRQAAEVMRGWNPIKEGFYMDQASTYGMELNRRKAA
jgi:hypothetical protein